MVAYEPPGTLTTPSLGEGFGSSLSVPVPGGVTEGFLLINTVDHLLIDATDSLLIA